MVKKKTTFGSVFIGIQAENLILVYFTGLNLAELHIVTVIQWKNNDAFFKCGIQQCEI